MRDTGLSFPAPTSPRPRRRSQPRWAPAGWSRSPPGCTDVRCTSPPAFCASRVAAAAGIPALTFEIGEGGRLEEDSVVTCAACILNAMRHLGLIDAPAATPPPSRLVRNFVALRARQGGLLVTVPPLGAPVRACEVVCQITDVFGDALRR